MTPLLWINGKKVGEVALNFTGFLNEDTVWWKEHRLGLIPRRCYFTNKLLWPFTKVGVRYLMHVSNQRIYSKGFFCTPEQATIANLKMK